MADLEEEHKLYILEQLAMYRPPTRIQDGLLEVFKVKASLPQISFYIPKPGDRWNISDEHKKYFLTMRQAFLTDSSRIALTQQNYRLQRLQDILDDPVTGKSAQRILQVIELYEKIQGGQFLKKKEEDTSVAEGLNTLRKFLGVKSPDSKKVPNGK